MKRIVLVLVFLLAAFPIVAFASNPAPYTDEALEKINKALKETPKEEYAKKEEPKEAYHQGMVKYFTDVFDKAGYSFYDTIDKMVDDMQRDPDNIPMDKPPVYNHLYVLLNLMFSECKADNVDCVQFFPPKTQGSVQWFMENNPFVREGPHNPHGAK